MSCGNQLYQSSEIVLLRNKSSKDKFKMNTKSCILVVLLAVLTVKAIPGEKGKTNLTF